MGITRVAAVAGLACGLTLGMAPPAHAAGPVLSGAYDVVTPNSTFDRWTITPQCSEAAIGCESDIESPLIKGQAFYKGANTWVMSLQGVVPVCPDKSLTIGAMQFQWNAETLDGQMTNIQRGKCVLSRPGQGQIAFKLVKANS
mgnify:FL=1